MLQNQSIPSGHTGLAHLRQLYDESMQALHTALSTDKFKLEEERRVDMQRRSKQRCEIEGIAATVPDVDKQQLWDAAADVQVPQQPQDAEAADVDGNGAD